jgi:hypothetical protein
MPSSCASGGGRWPSSRSRPEPGPLAARFNSTGVCLAACVARYGRLVATAVELRARARRLLVAYALTSTTPARMMITAGARKPSPDRPWGTHEHPAEFFARELEAAASTLDLERLTEQLREELGHVRRRPVADTMHADSAVDLAELVVERGEGFAPLEVSVALRGDADIRAPGAGVRGPGRRARAPTDAQRRAEPGGLRGRAGCGGRDERARGGARRGRGELHPARRRPARAIGAASTYPLRSRVTLNRSSRAFGPPLAGGPSSF